MEPDEIMAFGRQMVEEELAWLRAGAVCGKDTVESMLIRLPLWPRISRRRKKLRKKADAAWERRHDRAT